MKPAQQAADLAEPRSGRAELAGKLTRAMQFWARTVQLAVQFFR